jgi:hypothetical protein
MIYLVLFDVYVRTDVRTVLLILICQYYILL